MASLLIISINFIRFLWKQRAKVNFKETLKVVKILKIFVKLLYDFLKIKCVFENKIIKLIKIRYTFLWK